MLGAAAFAGFGRRRRPRLLPGDIHYEERLLAVARLALLGFLAVGVQLHQLGFGAAPWMLIGYGLYAAAVLLLLRVRDAIAAWQRWTIQCFDLAWAAAFTGANVVVGCVLFVFALIGAAHRWDRRETLLTAALGFVAVVLAASISAVADIPFAGSEQPFAPMLYVWLGLLLLVPAAIIGLVVGEDKRLRVEAALVSQTMVRSRQEHGIRATLQAVFDDLLAYLGADEVILAVADGDAGGAYLWRMTPTSSGRSSLRYTELDAQERGLYLFDGPPGAWLIRRRETLRGDVVWRELAINPDAQRTRLDVHGKLAALGDQHPFDDMLVTSDGIENWTGRLFVLGGASCRWAEADLRFLQRFFAYITPVMQNAYLLRRLRSRIGALERARVARELHDGVIQALFGIEMRVDALRRRTADGALAEEMGGVQMALRQEIAALRELMAQMKPLDLGPERLIDYLADYVNRFGRDTGINSSFMSDVQEVRLPARICTEIARVVQEALVNVRKHSGARNLLVKLTQTGGRLQILVDDDGRGFGFSGRYSHADLEQQRKGPWVIKERLRAIGGELTIQTAPGEGARLEIGIR